MASGSTDAMQCFRLNRVRMPTKRIRFMQKKGANIFDHFRPCLVELAPEKCTSEGTAEQSQQFSHKSSKKPRASKMKTSTIAIAFLILYTPCATFAGNYKIDGTYEITIPDDWLILSKTKSEEQMKSAAELVKKSKTNADIAFEDLSTPFMAYEETSNEAYLTRVIVGPAKMTKEEFNSLTVFEINQLGEEITKRQNALLKVSGIRILSTQSGITTFKGIPAIRTESLSYNSKGFKVSRAQYIVYRSSATLSISLEHTVLSGEPNYKLIESQISVFNVVAQ